MSIKKRLDDLEANKPEPPPLSFEHLTVDELNEVIDLCEALEEGKPFDKDRLKELYKIIYTHPKNNYHQDAYQNAVKEIENCP